MWKVVSSILARGMKIFVAPGEHGFSFFQVKMFPGSVSVLLTSISLRIKKKKKKKDREKEKTGSRPVKLNEKKGDRDLEQRNKKQRRHIFVGRPTEIL